MPITKQHSGEETPEENQQTAASELDEMRQMLAEFRSIKAENDRLKAQLWNVQRSSDIPVQQVDPEDLKLCTVLYGYGKVGKKDRLWVGGVGGTTWQFIGGICKDVPWSVAKHWKHNTRPDGSPVLGLLAVHVLPHDASEADYVKAIGFEPKSIEETAAMIAAADFTKLAHALPDNVRELLVRQLTDALKPEEKAKN